MFFQKDIETMPRKELLELQLQKLKATVAYCYHHTAFYRERLDQAGVGDGSKIKQLSDIQYIPYTTKDDFRDHYPFGLMAVPMNQIVRIHASSGTTGKPTVGVYTREDLDIWSDCVARVAVAGGVTADDIVQISFGYGLFTGALGLHYGLEKIGATVIPASSGNTEKQMMMFRDFGVTGLVATPSYALYLSEAVKEAGHPLSEYKLRLGILGSEPCTPQMRNQIEDNLHIYVSDNYGMTELGGPGVAGDCPERQGMHIAEDHFLPEIIDPETGERLGEGEQGELVVTTLSKVGMPVLRYRTKDITSLTYEPCPCGRTHVRMSKTAGRTDDMLIIKGVNVFPTQIESVILEMPEFEPHYLLLVDRKNNTDTMELQVEVRPEYYSDEINKMLALKKKLTARLQSVLGLGVDVRLVEPRSIERSVGKAKRVIDNRKL